MNNYDISLSRIEKIIPENLITNSLKDNIKKYEDKVSQILVNEEHGATSYFISSVHNFAYIIDGQLHKLNKDAVKSVKFIKGAPHGEVIIELADGTTLNPKDITYGRAFDYIQDIKPKVINLAGYDNTIRGEFPQLLDPDHAVENDRLRRWMQDGHISHYEYDDANPSYPKAGK